MTWKLSEDDLGSLSPASRATLFCVGNGQTTTRGTLSEERHEAFRGVYLSGLYTRAGYGLIYFMGAPDWLPACVRVGGRAAQCVESRRELDLAAGVLTRQATFAANGVRIEAREERFASFAQPHLMAQRFSVRLPDGGQGVSVLLGLDGEVRNHPAKYYQPGQFPNCDRSGLKLSHVEQLAAGPEGLRVVLKADASNVRAYAAALVRQTDGPELPCSYRAAGGISCVEFQLPAGGQGPRWWSFEKLCVLAADAPGHEEALAAGPAAPAAIEGLSYAAAREAHAAAVARFWNGADVEIDGDRVAQLAVRFALWATRIGAPDDGGASSCGAKNLTGDWYRGAVFWDMELFQLPLLTAVAPGPARNHILYRARRLDAARTLAAQDGYAGARYPWQSYGTGLEEPPQIGGFLYQQQHVSAAVAWGVLHYHFLTGDWETLLEHGLEVVLEVSRFWASRAAGPDAQGLYHLPGVCGPDELHPGVDDNSYTNFLVSWIWREAERLVGESEARDGPRVRRLLERTGVDQATRQRWRELAERLCVPMSPDGKTPLPFAGWEQLGEPDDRVYHLDGPGKDKRGKQADTLMLFQAAPEATPKEWLERCYRAYAPLCNHASSLSLCTHALCAIRLGLARDAERFYRAACGVDLADHMGDTADGIHAAGQAGIWLATVCGFGGLRVGDRAVALDPRLPPTWRSLRYRFRMMDQPLEVLVRQADFEVRNAGQRAVTLLLNGSPREVAPQQALRLPTSRGWRQQDLEAVIFDLDGVLLSTDRFHYLAWKELADELGLPFDEEFNHQLRGVSREESLKKIYGARQLPAPEVFQAQCDRKNARYVELVRTMTEKDVLPGGRELLEALRHAGVRCGVASASRNAPAVLERTGLASSFDAVADGNHIAASKPDPQGFYVAAQRLRVLPWNCIGVEDAAAGIEAIHRAGMIALGIGAQAQGADLIAPNIAAVSVEALRQLFRTAHNPRDPYLERAKAHREWEMHKGYAATLGFGKK
jgi:beta-phosphoglucomutase